MIQNRKVVVVVLCAVVLLVYLIVVTIWEIQHINLTWKARQNFQGSMAWQSRNLTDILRPDVRTCIVCPKVPDVCQDDRAKETIIYFVVSSPKNRKERDAIRSTWAQQADPRPFFITGIVQDRQVMSLLRREAKKFQDIVIEDFMDTYLNLTVKTGFILKNFLNICPDAKYLVKCDDDVFVNPTVVDAVTSEVTSELRKPLIGLKFEHGAVQRRPSSKYYMPPWMYDQPYFPSYFSGLGYLLPGESVARILTESFKVPLINNEDAFFTGIIANERLNMTLQSRSEHFKLHKSRIDSCLYKKVAMIHGFSAKDLRRVWRRIRSKDCNS
ncbi:beta-1,3-galactosyltransferase 1-like [Lutzomyia longipalpis]|uniref:beta-1,3-galactosyltransferase 1-like n=1 Tax=Lutzomyia longipalpis TaxID=7200 RepID=UPI002483E557|nr:beta-1,3-galactosyltransferase 1-like [Lutzomyia longipalpis]